LDKKKSREKMAMKKADKVEQTEYDSAREGWKRVNPDLARETENQERSQASQQERAQVRFFPQGSGYTVGILFGFFLVSKEFLVFNEETLVAVAFTLFVFLGVTKLGGTVREELDSKSQQIDEEYARSQRLEEDYVKHLISFYERQETAGKDILDFSEYVQGSLQGMFAARERQYEAEVWGQVVARLKRIRDLERRSTEAFQKNIRECFRSESIPILKRDGDRKRCRTIGRTLPSLLVKLTRMESKPTTEKEREWELETTCETSESEIPNAWKSI